MRLDCHRSRHLNPPSGRPGMFTRCHPGAIAARWTVTFLLSSVVLAEATPPPLYAPADQVPWRYAHNLERFDRLMAEGHDRTVRLAIFGDSQETSPGGAGSVMIPRLGYEFYQRFGNVPETQVFPHVSVGGVSGTRAEFLLQGGAPSPGPSVSRLASNQLLPGLDRARAHSTKAASRNINGQAYGQLTALRHDASRVSSGAMIPDGLLLFDPTGEVRAEIFAATHPDSGEVFYRARPFDREPSYFGPTSLSGEMQLGLQDTHFEVRSGLTEPLPYSGHTYMAVEVHGTDDTRLTDILGLRFRNVDRPEGVVVTDLSAGGYQASSFLKNHDDAGAYYRALGLDAAVITLGANDIAQGVELQTYEANLLAIIARLRSWTHDPDYPVFLVSDPPQAFSDPVLYDRADRVPGVHLRIAEHDPNVMSINLYGALKEARWGHDSPFFGVFHADDVHYTPAGARQVASALAAGLMGEPWSFVTEQPGDYDFNGVVDERDLPLLLDLYQHGVTAADLDQSGSLSRHDIEVWVTALFGSAMGDANLDRRVDHRDLKLLAGSFGLTGTWQGGDLDLSGVVDLVDLSILARHFGFDADQVPEPGTGLLLIGGLAGIGWRGRARPRARRRGGMAPAQGWRSSHAR
jgi:lysophospholipase L1-like esterase